MHVVEKFTPFYLLVLFFNIQVIHTEIVVDSGDYSPKFQIKNDEKLQSIKDDVLVGPIITCAVCHVAATGLMEIYKQQNTQDCIEALAIEVCEMFHIEDDMVCSSIIPLYKDDFLYIIGKLIVTPDQFCGLILPDDCRNAYHPRKTEWNVTLPNTPKPPVVPPTLPPNGSPTLRVLHLSDIHYDKLYQIGSPVDCQEPLCCRLYENPVNGSTELAGKWGNPTECDIPLWTLENLFQHLQTNEKFDYAIWTGDLPSHNVWNQTKDDQLTAYKTLTDLFLQYFPDKKLYSAVGNHESAPANSFPPNYPDLPKEFSIAWLYDALAESWTQWVNKSETENIQNIASYVARPFPGLRIISLNMMYCLTGNFWLYMNETDPDGALTWLIDQLQDAEDVGDKVHIIGHVPPGLCLPQWSQNYFNIIYRYESTVMGQFFGHTHIDQFTVFYENLNYTQRPFSMYYVGPSVTTYRNNNPAYRVYTIDGNYVNSTWRVLDHVTHFLNLTKANADPNNITDWELEYDAKTAYGLTTLFPDDWSSLISTMIVNDTIFNLYNTYASRHPAQCDASCKQGKLCSARSAVPGFDQSLCSDIPGAKPSASPMETSRQMDIAIKQLQKIFPNGIYINIPDQCKAQPSTTPTTPKPCHCGSSSLQAMFFLLLLSITILFI